MALILIADDDELIVEMVADALRPRGHVVGTLDDGRHVVDVVTVKRPALVILDCGMPTMCGTEVLRKMRASTSCFDTPVLMLTGRRSEADEEIAFRAGATDYMRKPFNLAELVERIESLILEAECRLQAASM
ncbi:response regulator transcription factor [Sphingomonas sp.]|uniref:response regulator transcription factor n=1 Tax=Sphingomonas sp. TaxID=28214 RepID=UPI00180108CB|nr:response regulator transcription factor [Sphingomonas sp.]MBA3511541.1 response regulator transcription factor [Sphingomonas sp.]